MTHCLETGGKHVEPARFRPMMACAEICTECATDCERLGGMDDCVQACKR